VRRAGALLALVLLLPACEGLLGGDEPEETVAPLRAKRVLDAVLEGLERAHEEVGPAFPARLPAIKDAAARREEFDGWDAFQNALGATDEDLPLDFSRRISEKMLELVEKPPPAEEE
jgi:hypothetical protein